MDEWKKDVRRDVVIVDIDTLVPQDHLLRKIEKVMDYDWLYERLDSYYCHDNGRPGTDPVVLIKMVLIQHLYWIPIYNILEPTCKIVLAHPKYVKAIRGKKTDKKDAKCIIISFDGLLDL